MQRRSWVALVFVCTSGAALALAAACGSEVSPESADNGDGSSGDSSAADGDPLGSLDGGAVLDGDSSAEEAFDCGLTPTLHENKPLRCPNAGASSTNCPAAQRCCQPPVDAGGPSTCTANCPPAPDGGPFAGVIWECQDPAHCAALGGGVCCGVGTTELDGVCGYMRSRTFRGTTCKAACATNEFIVCEDAGHCPNGLTCTPIKARGAQLGACLPP